MIDQETYAIVMWRDEKSILTLDVEGEDVLPVWESTGKIKAVEAAKAHAMIRNLKPGWEVVPGPASEFLELLEVLASSFEYLTINPPISVKGEEPPAIRLIPIRGFVG